MRDVIPCFSCLFSLTSRFFLSFLFCFSDVACKSAARPRQSRQTPTSKQFAAPLSPKRSSFPISSSKSPQVIVTRQFSQRRQFGAGNYHKLICLSSHYAVNAAPEDWRELRTKSEMHSQELTGLHLADWVSHLAISISSLLGDWKKSGHGRSKRIVCNRFAGDENRKKERKKKSRLANTSGNDDKRLRASHARRGIVRLTFLRAGVLWNSFFPANRRGHK